MQKQAKKGQQNEIRTPSSQPTQAKQSGQNANQQRGHGNQEQSKSRGEGRK